MESDQIRGFELGADDYVTKPFSMSVFLKKVAALLARISKQNGGDCYEEDRNLLINFSEMTAMIAGQSVSFTPMEYRLLKVLTKNPKRVLTRKVLLEKLWDIDENFVDEHTLTSAMSRVRNKIDGISNIHLQKEQTIMPDYSEEVFYPYILDKYQSQGIEAPGANYYEQYFNRFYSQLVSIDAEKLKGYMTENGMDYESFCHGKYRLLVSDNPSLFPEDLILQFQCGQLNKYEVIPDGKAIELPIRIYFLTWNRCSHIN